MRNKIIGIMATFLCTILLSTAMTVLTGSASAQSDEALEWGGALVSSAEDGGLFAGIVLDEETNHPMLVIIEQTESATSVTRYERLPDPDMDISGMRLKAEMPGGGYTKPMVTLILKTKPDGMMNYLRLYKHEQDEWQLDMLVYDFDGQTYVLYDYPEGLFATRVIDEKGTCLAEGALDTSPSGFSLEEALPVIRDTVDGFWTAQGQDAWNKLSRAFPDDDWSTGELAAWDWRTKDSRYVVLASVDRVNERTTYLLDHTQSQPQAIRAENAVPFAARMIRFNLPCYIDPAEDERSGVTIEYALDEIKYNASFSMDNGKCVLQSLICKDQSQEDGEEWAVYFVNGLVEYHSFTGFKPRVYLGCIDIELTRLDNIDLLQIHRTVQQLYADYLAGEPPFIPVSSGDFCIPQPIDSPMRKGKYDVYSGPGHHYFREANGKACVSTNDWVQVFGREGDWALIQYRVKENHFRFGYVYKSAFRDFDAIPQLNFEAVSLCQDNGFVTSDPLGRCGYVELTGTPYDMTRLAVMDASWMYVELTLPNGQEARMFAEIIPSHG